MSQPNVVPRVNSMIQSMERAYIDLTDTHQTPAAGTYIAVYFTLLRVLGQRARSKSDRVLKKSRGRRAWSRQSLRAVVLLNQITMTL